MSSPCSQFKLFPLTSACGAHGTCNEELNVCQCDPGWISEGDLYPVPGSTCNINIAAIQVMWSILAAINIAFVPYAVLFLIRKIQMGRDLRKDLISIVAILGLLCGICLIITGILRASNPEKNIIGIDALTTIVFGFSATFFWTGACFLLVAFFKMIVGNLKLKDGKTKENTQKMFTAFKRLLPVIAGMNLVWCFVPTVLLVDRSETIIQLVAGLHYIGLASSIMILGFGIPLITSSLVQDLEEAVRLQSSNDLGSPRLAEPTDSESKSGVSKAKLLSNALMKLKKFRKELRSQAIQQTIVAILFGVWPFFTSVASYQLPVAWTVGSLVFLGSLITVDNRSSRSGSTSPRTKPRNLFRIFGGNRTNSNSMGSSFDQRSLTPFASPSVDQSMPSLVDIGGNAD